MPAVTLPHTLKTVHFTLVEKAPERQYFYVSTSRSTGFINWSEPKMLTEKDNLKNYSSPGNIIEYNGEYYLCLQTYPREDAQIYINEKSRVFTMKNKNLIQG